VSGELVEAVDNLRFLFHTPVTLEISDYHEGDADAMSQAPGQAEASDMTCPSFNVEIKPLRGAIDGELEIS
jgi:hypothetical protein